MIPPVETGIPVPPQRRDSYPYGLDRLDLMQSVFVPEVPRSTVAAHAFKTGKRLKRKFITRLVENGTRVWRVD